MVRKNCREPLPARLPEANRALARPLICVMLLSKAAHSDTRVLAEARVLEQAGWKVVILSWDREKRFPADVREGRVHILDLGHAAAHGAGAAQIRSYFSFWRRCLFWLLRHDHDVVHCHDFDTVPAGWLAARLRRRKVVFDGHEPYGEAFAPALPGPVASGILWLERRLTPRIDVLVSPSPSCAAYYIDRGAPRHVIFENYKDPGEFDFAPERLAARRRALGLEGKLVLAHAGLLDHHVCLDRIVEAVSTLPGVVFVAAGSGRLAPWMAEQARLHDSVRYLGQLPAEEARELIALSDCVNCLVQVAPEIRVYGTASNKLFDALAAGRAVLCCQASSEIARVTEEYQCGVCLGEDFTVEELRQALLHLRDQPDRRAGYGANARRACFEKYNRTAAGASLLRAYGWCAPEFHVESAIPAARVSTG